ncbi:MAG: DUF4349 domain-containing protein [Spirochaetes bacterium]|nr:DUF4349 domain-containing protein [Spirochaetota bacterium]
MRLKLAVVFMLSALSAAQVSAEDTRIFRYEYFLLTESPDRAVESLRKSVAGMGGYVKYFSSSRISVRVPDKSFQALKEGIGRLGYIFDEQLFRSDVAETVNDLRTRLAVKEKLMSDLYRLFNESKLHQTIEIEEEIGKVVMEIEKIKGELAYYSDKTSLYEVNVHMNVKPGEARTSGGPSKWQWINGLGIEGMMRSW